MTNETEVDGPGYTLTPAEVRAWQVGSGPPPWWVVDQDPVRPGEGKNWVLIRTARGDVEAGMGDYVVRGLGGALSVFGADDFARTFLARDGSRPPDRAAFDERRTREQRDPARGLARLGERAAGAGVPPGDSGATLRRLVAGLRRIRAAVATGVGSIGDTVWIGPGETLNDAIDDLLRDAGPDSEFTPPDC